SPACWDYGAARAGLVLVEHALSGDRARESGRSWRSRVIGGGRLRRRDKLRAREPLVEPARAEQSHELRRYEWCASTAWRHRDSRRQPTPRGQRNLAPGAFSAEWSWQRLWHGR